MSTVSVIGVYPVDSDLPCYLVELAIGNCTGIFDLSQITQAVHGQPRENWQAPYAEQLISWDGLTILTGPFEAEETKELWIGNIRIGFFFHFLNFAIPLQTPFGNLSLPAPSTKPDRLSDFEEYEEP
jgi:hypothetical protein